VAELREHPLRFYYDYGMRVTINTDNRLMSGVTMTDEFWKIHDVLGFTLPEIKDLIIYGFKSSFQSHRLKVDMIQQVLSELKTFREDPAEELTHSAVADIPTESFTDSKQAENNGKSEGEKAEKSTV
jgi:adenosine deaminase